MRDWTKSIYSDGTEGFVSNPSPKLGEEITISLSMMENAPVREILLWRIVNGAESFITMEKSCCRNGLDYYSVKTVMNEPLLQYHFVVVTEEVAYFYTQAGVETIVPDYRHDFIIRTDYVDSNNIPREAYYIEITESAFVEDAGAVIPVISKIRESGFKVEIDDFGSGYSSFGALIDLPFDVLKIDMAIIKSMDKSPKVKEIIKMLINLSKTMDAITVAEGVETKEQCDFLKENGCDVVQGYYLSRPLPLEDFEKLIEGELKNGR